MDFDSQKEFDEYARKQFELLNHKIKPSFHKYNTEGIKLTNAFDDKLGLKKAQRCFEKALALATNNEYTKAVACHDLGVFYFTHFARLPGAPHSNLNKAASFFSRAIANKQRQQFPDKYASSLSQLAAVYRRAANEQLWYLSREESLVKSEELHRKALKVLERSIPAFIRLNQLSIIYLNLAATLFDIDKTEKACDSQAKAFICYKEAIDWCQSNFPVSDLNSKMSLKPDKIIPLTISKLTHLSKSKEHKELCKSALEMALVFGLDPLDMMRVNPHVDISNPIVEIQLLVKEADEDSNPENVDRLSKKVHSLMVGRQSTETDQESDRVGVLIQQASSGLARVLVKKEKCIQAFITLENTSAMRFCESTSLCWLHIKDPVGQVLLGALRKLGSIYYGLNEIALMASHVNKSQLHNYLSDSAKLLKSQRSQKTNNEDVQIFNDSKYANIVDFSSRASNPLDFLKQQASLCLGDFKILGQYIDRLDTDYVKDRQRTYQITLNDLREAINTHPDQVLVKIDIEDHYNDVLVIVAYLQNNQITARGYLFNLPKNLINNVAAFVTDHKEVNTDWDLGFIDWKLMLPSHLHKVCLLPSFFASHIPWGATGKTGEKLYQLVNEVNWLPSLMYLYEQVKYYDDKTTITSVVGGDTLFDKLALHDNILTEVAESQNDFLHQLYQSNIFSFYGHCEHKHPDRPKLLFENYFVRDADMLHSVRGAERIEFWACQSGSNIPLHFLPSQVNEPFGMDMRMLESGAKTAIGSLWAVPELVTAHIKAKYDKLKNNNMSASEALLRAQRWWIESGVDEELNKITTLGEKEYLKMLECNYTENQELRALMGPILARNFKAPNVDMALLERSLKHPSAWSGMRFCGISEQQNKYIPRSELSSDQQQKVNTLITQMNLQAGFIKNAR
ncbi:CHAT domain-containing protein [Colwellia sp. Arc7-D]|uniref:CHAT domain-containing protein n=1 Tax=Colwellia sp. Arc7-D TaxID=2161872 RepID=UPI000D3972DC|nr:CHAT domain-containing protein [Colwellia sp. Arc7-D]AWB57858.1 hypothetical protein DBO93_09925 [Colwellia sp. Arc7-D]